MTNKNKLNWNEIEEAAKAELDRSRSIMTFATIGSRNIEHDIDLIITKNPNSSSRQFYQEIHSFFDSMNKFVHSRTGGKAIRFASFTEQFSAIALAGYNPETDLALHTMIYTSYPQIVSNWAGSFVNGTTIEDVLKTQSFLKGSVADLENPYFQKPTKADPLFIMLYKYDKLNSLHPDNVLVPAMNHYLDYIQRKRMGLPFKEAGTIEEARNKFYELCDILDSFNSQS